METSGDGLCRTRLVEAWLPLYPYTGNLGTDRQWESTTHRLLPRGHIRQNATPTG
jgi:hypothetical protein